MKRLLPLLSLFFFLPLPLFAAEMATRDYLRKQDLDAWTAMARGAIGDTIYPPSLQSLPKQPVTELSKFILALVANGIDPRFFSGHDYLADVLAEVKDDQIGDPRRLNDDAWGLLALRAGGLPTNHLAVLAVKRNLILTQNTDGGWGSSIGGASDTNDTAAIMMALSEAGVSPLDPSIQHALGYLATQENDDGGFSFDHAQYPESDAASDAWVVSALTKVGSTLSFWKKNNVTVVDHLRSLYRPDGCYTWQKGGLNCSPGITAWVAIALEWKSYPVRGTAMQEAPVPSPRDLPPTPLPVVYIGPMPTGIAQSVRGKKEIQQFLTISPGAILPGQDSDGDGFTDVEELQRGYDPHDPAPCPRIAYSTTLKSAYGGARLASAMNEACRARYVRKELEKILGKRLTISSRVFATLANAYIYGGYSLKDVAMAAKGAKTVHPTIWKEVWVKR